MRLAELTWLEARDAFAVGAVAILPIGATEAHGPHLPLDTDVQIAVGAADRVAALLVSEGTPALVLPPLAYGVSFVGTSFAGTLPVAVETMTAVVRDVLVGLDRYGCTAGIIVNSHLEPAHAVALNAGIAAAEAATDERLRVVFPDLREERWSALLSEEFRRGARHAGGYETALMMIAAPDAVREPERQRLQPVWIDLPGKLRAGEKTFAEAGATLGYFGDPASATVAEGEILFDALAHIYVTALHERLAR
ncbi:MAG: creatininase family protein [Chloroflexota bacterium]|nr:creatininase family protein [Chloroflexota bacterium]